MQGLQNRFRVKLKNLQTKQNNGSSRNSLHLPEGYPSIQNSITKLNSIVQDLATTLRTQSFSQTPTVTPERVGPFNSSYQGSEDYQKWFSSILDQSKLQRNQVEIEERFQLIDIKVPLLEYKIPNSKERKYEIFDWLSQTCRLILSASFQLLLQGRLNFQITKVYCSENLLVRIIQLVKINDLTKEQIRDINLFLKDQLLPYFQKKYPQSETSQVNLRLSNKLEKIDNYISNSNDIVFQSKVKFQYDERGQYHKQIMEVLNFIIRSPNKTAIVDIKNQEMLEVEKYLKKQKYEENRSSQYSDRVSDQDSGQNEKNQKNEELSIYGLFERDMQRLFKSVQSEDQLIRMKEKMSPLQHLKRTPEGQQGKDPAKEQHYKEKVRQYTKYEIGRKVSESVLEYSYEELKSENLVVKNSQILRILDKWCTHLRKKFEMVNQIIEDRDEPFRMQDGSESYLPKTHRILLKKIMKKQEQKLDRFLNEVMQNNYGFQQKISKYGLPKEMEWYQKNQSRVGVFTSVLFFNTESYIISYLNILIHTLLETTRYFNEIICIENKNKNKKKKKVKKPYEELVEKVCSNQEDVQGLMNLLDETINKHNQMNYEFVPQLVTFRIGDIVRCRCASKQTEIIAIYNEIMRISDSPSSLWKVIRIKNRLFSGTKDILINLSYRKQVIAEIQLRVGESKEKFIVSSGKFTHYLYELERAQFGPISEMANIWMGMDNRASFYKGAYQKLFTRQKAEKALHNCNLGQINEELEVKNQKFPFICCQCKKLWTHRNFIYDHILCLSCGESICGHCQIERDSSIIKYKIRQSLGDKLNPNKSIQFKQVIPDVGCCLMLYSKQIKIQYFRKIVYEYKSYLFEILENSEPSLITQITTEKQIKAFNKSHLVIALDDVPQHMKQAQQEKNKRIAKEFFVPKAFKEIIKKKKTSIMQQKKNLEDRDLKRIDPSPEVLKINFSENIIQQFDLIIEKFPKVEIVVMVNNDIKRLNPSIKKLSTLQYLDLSKNQIQKLPQEITSLSLLKDLDLSFNQITDLPKDLKQLSNLSVLIMSHNRIKCLEELPPNLKKLDLQFNKIKGKVKFSHKKLIVVNLSNNSIDEIENLSESQDLRKLEIFRNHLKSFHITNLYKLESLNASFNHLEEIKINFENPLISSLKSVNLKSNNIKVLGKEFYRNVCILQSLNISSNPLVKITEDIFALKKLEELYASKIRKNMQQSEQMKEQILPAKIHLNLLELDYIELNSNQLKEIPKVIQKMNHVKEITLSHNRIRKIATSVPIEDLDLSHNQLEQFTEEDAQKLASLKFLNISYNKFGESSLDIHKIKSIMKQLNVESLFEDVTIETQSTIQGAKNLKACKQINKENHNSQKTRNSIDLNDKQKGGELQLIKKNSRKSINSLLMKDNLVNDVEVIKEDIERQNIDINQ